MGINYSKKQLTTASLLLDSEAVFYLLPSGIIVFYIVILAYFIKNLVAQSHVVAVYEAWGAIYDSLMHEFSNKFLNMFISPNTSSAISIKSSFATSIASP